MFVFDLTGWQTGASAQHWDFVGIRDPEGLIAGKTGLSDRSHSYVLCQRNSDTRLNLNAAYAFAELQRESVSTVSEVCVLVGYCLPPRSCLL